MFFSVSPLSNLASTSLFCTHHLNLKPHFRNLTSLSTIPPPPSSSSSFSLSVSSCDDLRTLRKIHASLLVSAEHKPFASLASKLITSYARLHDLDSAISVFKDLPKPDTLAWNSIIKSHVDLGFYESALHLYARMRELGIPHDLYTLPIINRAASSFPNRVGYGGSFHCVAIQSGFASDLYFCNTLITSYVKAGSLGDARKVFDEMPERDFVAWTSIISGYAIHGSFSAVFRLFNEMRMNTEPNSVTMIIMLQACAASRSLIGGRKLHCYAAKKGFLNHEPVKNSLLKMYSRTDCAREVEIFCSEIYIGDVISWNILIAYFVSRRDIAKVAETFNEMSTNVQPSTETLTLVFSAFADSGDLFGGKKLHCFVLKTGLCDRISLTSLLNCYAKCGELDLATKLFVEIPDRNGITWSAMMSGFIQNGCFIEAIELFNQIQAAGIEPGAVTLGSLMVACTNLGTLRLGKQIHGYIVRNLFWSEEEDDSSLETTILNFYIRCGSITSARLFFHGMTFKDIVAWTSIIEGCGIHGLGIEALRLFDIMVIEGIEPNRVTFLSLLSACSHCGLVWQGFEVFLSMKWIFGIDPDLEHYTCLVDLLGRSGKLMEALCVILKMVALPDSRIWGALLAASRIHGNGKVGEYAAERVLELKPDCTGYYILVSNMQASVERWGEVEGLRRGMNERDLKKKPGWSCIEANGEMHGFVSGNTSHPSAPRIYEVLGHLSRAIQDFGWCT